MNKEILNTLVTLSKDETVNKVFKNRVTPSNPSKAIINVEKWLLQVYQGTFIDSKFDQEWLKHHGITKEMLKPLIGDMPTICSLFAQCVKDCASVSDFYDSYDEFIYSANTFKSGFLRHATKFIGSAVQEHYKNTLKKTTYNTIVKLSHKTTKNIWPSVKTLEEWFNEHFMSILSANHRLVHHKKYIHLDFFLTSFMEYIDENVTNLSIGVLKPNSYMFWNWIKQVRQDTGVNFYPSPNEVHLGVLSKTYGKKSTNVIKPKEYITWTMERRVIWDLKNTDKKFDKEIHAFWEHCNGDEEKMFEFLLDR